MINLADPITYTVALFAGMSASFYPCLFPVLPSFIAFIASESAKNERLGGLVAGVLVTLGIMSVFLLFGFVINSFLDLLSINYIALRSLQGVVLVFVGILLAANISLSFAKIESTSAFLHGFLQRMTNPWLMAFFIGFFFALLAAPCALVIFISLGALVVGEGLLETTIVMILFSVGAGVPFVIIGILVPSVQDTFEKKFDKSKQFIVQVHKFNRYLPRIAGVLVIVIGVALIAGIDFYS